LQENERKYFILNKPLPDDILKKTLVSLYGDDRKLPLGVVLNKFRNKGIYIDLWASWCAPCRMDIRQSSGTKSMLAAHGFEYLYFSIDVDRNAWKAASQQDKIAENQFIFEPQSFSDFKKFLGELSIPRYIILDKHHRVKNLYAPRPNDVNTDQIKQMIEGL
jgi:thiol-disulfide isomerase/thioredoxin